MSKGPAKNLHDAQRNARLAWLSQNIAKGKTDTQIILECMAAFKCSEKIARQNLKEIYERFAEIENDNLANAKTKFMEMGMAILEQCRDLCQMGPAVNQFKALASMAGVVTDKAQVDQNVATSAAPDAAVVRERIAKLYKDRKVKEEAEAADVDLVELHKKAYGED